MQLGAWVVGKPERISACIDHWLMWDWVKPKRDDFLEWRFFYAMIFLRHDSKFDVRTRAPKVLIHIHISVYIYIYVCVCVYNYLIWYLSNSPNGVSTLKGSCGRSWGRCLVRGLQLFAGFFPVDSRIKWNLRHVQWAFRLRRLAQSLRGESPLNLVCGIFLQNSLVKWLLLHVHVHFDCAGARTKWLSRSWGAAFFQQILV